MTEHRTKRSKGRRRSSSRRRRERDRNRKIVLLLAVILVIVLIIVGAIVLLTGKSPGNAEKQEAAGLETSDENEEEEQEEQRGLQFPYELEENGLEINSILSSDLMNPDAGNELTEQLAGLEVTNISEQYLISADIDVTLTDGTNYSFRVEELPAGGKTIAFAPDNATYDDVTPCETVVAKTEFASGDQLMADRISVSVDGTTVTLMNLSQEELGPLTVICHDSLDETECFGGSSYAYQTAVIPAGESVTVEAVDCILGQPTVVRIIPEN